MSGEPVGTYIGWVFLEYAEGKSDKEMEAVFDFCVFLLKSMGNSERDAVSMLGGAVSGL